MNTTSVLIVGAGPSGLAMAAFLSRYLIPFRIIDKGISASDKSKALVVQARTLEVFKQLGLDKKAAEAGAGATAFVIYNNGQKTATTTFSDTDEDRTPFPYAEVLPQDRTEKILIEYLLEKGIEVEWQTSLENIETEKGKTIVTLKKDNTQTEQLSVDYLIGADGAHSIVRHYMKTEFVGEAYKQGFILADLDVDWDIPNEGLLLFIEKNCFGIFFPFKSGKKYRLITLLPEAVENPDFEFLKTFIEHNLSIPIRVSNPQWISHYRVHHRCVEHFRKDNIFLVGDAAHIHSPAGGQGMNTGIQDAHNLAWKLAMVIRGVANEQLLDSYHLERWRIAQHLVKGTDRAFQMIANSTPLTAWLRNNVIVHLLGGVMRFKKPQELLFHFVSQTAINYEHHYADFDLKKHPVFKSGRRFPYFNQPLTDGRNIYDLLSPDSFHLFVFDDNNHAKIEEALTATFNGFLKIHHFLAIKESQLYEHYQIKEPLIVLVRPDMHIACVGNELSDLIPYKSVFLN